MPFLSGQRKPSSVLLAGGARYRKPVYFWERFLAPKGTRVQSVKRIGIVGKGVEGVAYRVEVVVEKNGKQRTLHFVEKEFFDPFYRGRPLTGFRNPVEQFNIARTLIRLNRLHALGLHLPKTVRLLKRPGQKTSLVLTFIRNLVPNRRYFSPGQREQFETDLIRQQGILKAQGFMAREDSFFPQADLATGTCLAVLGDFGGISSVPNSSDKK